MPFSQIIPPSPSKMIHAPRFTCYGGLFVTEAFRQAFMKKAGLQWGSEDGTDSSQERGGKKANSVSRREKQLWG